jgi:hypothetical protein
VGVIYGCGKIDVYSVWCGREGGVGYTTPRHTMAVVDESNILNVLFVCTAPRLYGYKEEICFSNHCDIMKQLRDKYSHVRTVKHIGKLYRAICENVRTRVYPKHLLVLDYFKAIHLKYTNEMYKDISQLFIGNDIKWNALDLSRNLICETLMRLYPGMHVKYSTCDSFQIDTHKEPEVAKEILRHDKMAYHKYRIRMKFMDHYYINFQKHINNPKLNKTYDVIWFMIRQV